MKLFAVAIVGAAVAEKWDPKENDPHIVDTWNGFKSETEDTFCGMNYEDNSTSIVNQTCYISIPEDVPSTFHSLYVGNGAFVVSMTDKMATITGFDGVSTTVQYNAVFVQNAPDAEFLGEKDNGTCWHTVVDCEDNGTFKYEQDALLMESVNSDNGANHYNFQATGHWFGGVMTVQLVDDNGDDLALDNVTCNGCVDLTVNGNTIAFILKDMYSEKSTFSFGANTDKTPNVWKSSIEVA